MDGSTPEVPAAVGRDPMFASTGSNSTVSELTTPSRSFPRRNHEDLQLSSTLASLAGATTSTLSPLFPPVGRLADDEEEALEIQWYDDYENCDSDVEDPDIVDTLVADTAKDRLVNAEDNDCALDTLEQYMDDWKTQVDEEPGLSTARNIPGAPAGWSPPGSSLGWTPAERKHGQPPFEAIDNPAKWSEFTFRPHFTGTVKKNDIKYAYHCLPTGATPVPLNADGNRSVGGWDFHYKDWNRQRHAETMPIYRSGATRDNMFPECRKGSLDGELLSNLGLTAARMCEKEDGAPDALFFYQLLLPIHHIGDKKVTTIENDPRLPFYTNVSVWSNMYAAGELRILGSGYGHQFHSVEPPELLQWDGSLVMDGVLGGSKGGILRRFDTREGNTLYNELMAKTFTKSRWLELKRVYKMCNNLTSKKRGEDGYNPAYKYDYLFKTLVHNVNAMTLQAGLDLAGDETTFGFNGWGESGTGLLGLIMNKPGITRGGQIVVAVDVDRIRPRAYIHRHKLQPRPIGTQGESEVRLIYEELLPLITGTTKRRSIFTEKPHITWDNFFSGDNIMKYAAEQGFGFTSTCRRDRLPKGIPTKYLHKGKTDSSARPKAARFEQPIFAIKVLKEDTTDKEKVSGVMQLTSFQSTSSCNFTSVNALNTMSLYCQPKERGRGLHKRRWAIEMNEARQLYLKTYGAVDKLDHLVQNCNMSYRSWKYWHAPMLHGKCIAVVVAYDMYLECCEGKMRAGEWKTERPVDFHRFREKLAKQMLLYTPKDRKYPGDEQFRVSTRQHKDRRPPAGLSSGRSITSLRSETNQPGASGLPIKKKDFQSIEAMSRHCGDLTPLYPHVEHCISIRNGGKKTCVVCGEQAYHVCMACTGPDGKKGVALHRFARAGKPVACFYHHHNTHFFGLARNDHKLLGKRKRDWHFPTQEEIKSHAKKIRHVLTQDDQVLVQVSAATPPLPPSGRHNNRASGLASRSQSNNRLTRVDSNGNLVGEI